MNPTEEPLAWENLTAESWAWESATADWVRPASP